MRLYATLLCGVLAAACKSEAGTSAQLSPLASVFDRTGNGPPGSAGAVTVEPSSEPVGNDRYHQRVSSHGGRLVAVSEYNRSLGKSTLRVEKPDGSDPRVLVDMRAFRVKGDLPDAEIVKRAEEIIGPRFSPDDATIYFLANAWGTDHALYAVDVRTSIVTYVSNSNSLLVIDMCANPAIQGKLVVTPHHGRSLLNFHGIDVLDRMFLLDERGEVLGLIDKPEAFFAMYCTAPGKEGASRPLHRRAPQFRQFVCRELALRAYTINFLEGGNFTDYYSPWQGVYSPNWTAPEYIAKHCPEKLRN